jgi:hypothetical protein
MKNSHLAKIAILLFATTVLSGAAIVQNARAQSLLELHLFAPATATPGQTIAIELWTLYENSTSGRPDLAFNATGESATTCSVFPCLSFLVKINLGISAPPHIHTPSGAFVALPTFAKWVHPGAWNTSYTVPSQIGLYGVHMYANYTIKTGPNSYTSYVSQTQTTFTVKSATATPTDVSNGVSGLASQSLTYGVLGLVVVAIILDALILFWKKTPAKTA